MRSFASLLRLTGALMVLALAGCDCGGTTDVDAGHDAGSLDSGRPDAGRPDAGPADSGTPDAGQPDSGSPDSGQLDGGAPDSGSPDSGSPDAGPVDAGQSDAGTRCGNGLREGGEACDDANGSEGDGCSSACALELGFTCAGTPSLCAATCGDGRRVGNETCDDGATLPDDGCSPACQVQPGFTCSMAMPNVCVTTCGDGVRAGTEACDDGDLDPGDGCAALCTVEANYTCTGSAPSLCAPTCGDSLIIAPETCDDGDAQGNDGCSPTCRVEAGYACTGLPSTCTPVCNDGLIVGDEECDDLGRDSNDGCSSTCKLESGYVCSGIPSSCVPICGNGLVQAPETCDDGDLDPLDGCSASCRVETGYVCNGAPSTCSAACGDGIVLPSEECDDGNTTTGDGCNACRVQAGFSCVGQPSVCTGRGQVVGISMNGAGVDVGHGCLVTSSGLLFCFGANTNGEVGDGTIISPVFAPKQVAITNVVEVASGEAFTCALRDAGTVSCWGDNLEQGLGQPGRATASDSTTPLDVPGVVGAVELSAGDDHACARLASGQVLCWGDNDNRQIGRGPAGPTTDVDTAGPVVGLSNAARLAAGGDHTCALTTLGTVMCWGDAALGQQGNGTSTTDVTTATTVGTLSNVVDLAAGAQHSCAVTGTGQLFCWGAGANGRLGLGSVTNQNTPQSIPTLTAVTNVEAGARHTCAVSNGDVYCWGDGSRGQLGNGVPIDQLTPTRVIGLPGSPSTLDLGDETSCALYATGDRWCWGQSEDGQLGLDTAAPLRLIVPTPVSGLAQVTALAVTRQTYRCGHSCAVVAGNELFCWGENTAGQLGDGTQVPKLVPQRVNVAGGVIDVAVTMQSTSSPTATNINSGATCAVTVAGQVLCWGGNVRGMLGDGTTANHAAPAPANTGAVPGAGITAGQDFFCSRHTDGTVRCWGDNSSGQLGLAASTTPVSTPTLVAGLSNVIELAAGEDHVCALLDSGAVSCWGENADGSLGQGNTTDLSTPTLVPGVSNAVQIAVGQDHSCARTQAGAIICWGQNLFGQQANGSTADVLTATVIAGFGPSLWLTAGNNFTCSVTTAGQVQCVGYALDGHFGDGGGVDEYDTVVTMPGVAGISRVVGNNNSNFLITPTGTLQALGFLGYGNLGVNRSLRPTAPVLAPF